MASDLYKLLGVGKTATQDAITKAYRKLSLKWHPDRNPGDERAQNRFLQIQAAYEVLADPGRRAYYDATGETKKWQDNPELTEMLNTLGNLLGGTLKSMGEQGLNPKTTDVLDCMKQSLADGKRQIQKAKEHHAKAKVIWQDVQGRFTTEGEDNFLEMIIANQVLQIDIMVANLDREFKKLDKAAEVLVKYRYKFIQTIAADWPGGTPTTSRVLYVSS